MITWLVMIMTIKGGANCLFCRFSSRILIGGRHIPNRTVDVPGGVLPQTSGLNTSQFLTSSLSWRTCHLVPSDVNSWRSEAIVAPLARKYLDPIYYSCQNEHTACVYVCLSSVFVCDLKHSGNTWLWLIVTVHWCHSACPLDLFDMFRTTFYLFPQLITCCV